MAFNFSPKVIRDGLVLALDAGNPKSYPGSGTNWFDLSGKSKTGVLTGGPTFSTDRGGAISFNGSNQKIIFNATNFPTSYTKIVVFNGADTSARNLISSITPVDHAYWLFGGKINAGHAGNYQIVSYNISVNTWYYSAVTYDNNSNEMILYLNGVSVSSGYAATLTTGGDYKIGEHSSNQSFNGKIPYVFMYNRVLSATEILQNYTTIKSRFGL